ncbi:MAG: hypothetical protein KA804_01650 [Ottowia sp.]|nr:hypothetical protein [Ottowia sp.]
MLIDHDTETDVLVEREVDVVLEKSEPEEIIITEAVQGPPGPPGDASGALLVGNRLSEFDTPAAREQAQANLGLGVADPLAYYILAKA